MVNVIAERRGRGRPKIGPGIGFCLPQDIIHQLDNMAMESGLSRADIVREMFFAGWEHMNGLPVRHIPDPRQDE